MNTERAYTAALRLYAINQMMNDYQREFGRSASDDVMLYRTMDVIVEGCIEFGDSVRTRTWHPAAPDTSTLVMVDILQAGLHVPIDPSNQAYWWDAHDRDVTDTLDAVGTFARLESA